KLWAHNGEAVRQAIELGEIAHIETASEELTDAFLLWLLLDSRVVDVLRLSNLILFTLSSLQPFLFHGLEKAQPFSDTGGAQDPHKSDRRCASQRARTASCHGTGQPCRVSRQP